MDGQEVQNDFSGSADGVVQVGSIRGDVNFHLKARLPRPDQVPIAPTTFVNRQSSLQHLSHLLGEALTAAGTSRVTTLSGSPGVGKTALAVRWCHDVKGDFPDGNLYIDLKGYGSSAPITAGQALDTALRAFDVPAERIPEDLDERATLFRTLTGDRSVLLLLDNASSSEQVRRLLPSSPRSFVLVTSRSRLRGLTSREGAVRLDVDVLSPADAIDLLGRLIGTARLSQEPEAAERIARLCGFLPLTLRVVAERISSRSQDSLGSVVQELVSEQNHLDAVASAEDELSDTRAVFSWSYRKLSPELASTFRLLGLHPTSDISVEAAAALIDKPVSTTRRLLRELADVHLVIEAQNRFSMHDLLYSYARERALEEPLDARTRIIRRCLSWYLWAADASRKAVLPHSLEFPLVPRLNLTIPDFTDHRQSSQWFDRERPNLLASIRTAYAVGQYDICWKTASAVSSLFELRCYWDEWEQNHRIGFESAVLLGDLLGEAAHAALLGDVAARVARFDQAERQFEHALELAQRISLTWLEGFMHRGLGNVALNRSDFATAENRFQKSRDAFHRAGHSRGEAMATMSLGNLAAAIGEPHEAVRLCSQAVHKMKQLEDEWSVALVRLSLASALSADGDEDGAIEEWRSAAQIFARYEDKADEATAVTALAEVYSRRGERDHALHHWSRAEVLYESLKDPRLGAVREQVAHLASTDAGSDVRD